MWGLDTIKKLPIEYKEHTHLTPSKLGVGIALQTKLPEGQRAITTSLTPKQRGPKPKRNPKSA